MSQNTTPSIPGAALPSGAGSLNFVKDVTIPILIAAVAFFGSWLGVYLATQSSRETQRIEFAEQRARSDREKRVEVYTRFLDSIDAYLLDSNANANLCAATLPGDSENHPEQSKIAACISKGLLDSRESATAFGNSVNEVNIFGSDDSAAAADEVADAFLLAPLTTVSTNPGTGVNTPRTFDSNAVRVAQKKFRKIACLEIPVTPRSKC